MNVVKVRMSITLTAILTAIGFILLSRFFPSYSVLILSIEVILLPSIYIIGNYFAERAIKEQYESKINALTERFSELNDKYYKQKSRNQVLEYQVKEAEYDN